MPTPTEIINQALAFHRAGELQKAETLYREILARDPQNAEAWHLLGVVAHQVQQEAYALECIGRAISIQPNVSFYHNNLGEVFRAMGRLDEAVAEYRRALELNPESADVLGNLADVLKIQGKVEESVNVRQRAEEIRQREGRPAPEASVISCESAAYQHTIESALQSFPPADQSAAIAACTSVLRDNPGHVKALLLAGVIDATAGRLSMAEAQIRKAVRIDPANVQATTTLKQLEQLRTEAMAHSYFDSFLRERLTHMEYPRSVGIETLGHCNATCSFCPQGHLERRTTKMTDELFAKILRDLSAIPKDQPINIVPGGVNEPLLDRKIIERLQAVNQTLPQATLIMYTNFSIVPDSFFEGIFSIRNFKTINVSLNAANPEEYHAAMGLELDKTVANIRRFLTENRKHNVLRGPMVLSRVADHTEADERYKRQCRELFPEFDLGREYQVHVKHRTNWLGETKDKQSPIPHAMPCGAWLDLYIYCTGKVPLCCADADAKYAIGDLNRSSVLEVFNSRPFKDLRERATSREMIHPCSNCSLLQ